MIAVSHPKVPHEDYQKRHHDSDIKYYGKDPFRIHVYVYLVAEVKKSRNGKSNILGGFRAPQMILIEK